MRPAGCADLREALRHPQRLLRGVDREHVVADLHVEPGRLLVQPHERQRGRPILDQIDPLLVVLDRLGALALVRQRCSDLAMQLGHVLEVLLTAVVVEVLLPFLDRRVDPAEPQRQVALLLPDARFLRAVGAAQRDRRLIVRERLLI